MDIHQEMMGIKQVPSIVLDSVQDKIASDVHGKHIVYSGAGSGKSSMVCERVSRLIERHGVNPNNILLLSFSRDAAQVLRDRLRHDVNIRTVHSLCYLILYNELQKYDSNLFHTGKDRIKVCSGWQQRNIIKDILNDDEDITANEVLQEISFAKNRMQYKAGNKISTGNAHYDDIMYVYEAEKYNQGMIDFSDFVLLSINILKSSKRILKKYQNQFPYIIVDEGQDTLYSLHKIIELLVQDNVCYFLDNRQSIYGFTGIDLQYTLNLHSRYDDMKQWYMQNNYRSKTSIVELGNSIAEDMKFDVKPMTSIKTDVGTVEYLGHFDSQRDEANAVADTIDNPETTMILYRTNAQAMSIELALRKKGIPYYIRGLKSFFDFGEIKDVLAYIKLSRNPLSHEEYQKQIEAFDVIYNRPNRYFGKVWKKQFDSIIQHNDLETTLYYKFKTSNNGQYHSWAKAQEKLVKQLQSLRRFNYPSDVVQYIREEMGYDDWHCKNSDASFVDDSKSDSDNRKAMLANLDEFDSFIRMYDDFEQIFEQTENHNEDKTGVCLSTVHRSKGSEEKDVIAIGLTESVFPHIQGDSGEELRLFYVACTRAIDRLFISSAPIRQNIGPSRYISRYIQGV